MRTDTRSYMSRCTATLRAAATLRASATLRAAAALRASATPRRHGWQMERGLLCERVAVKKDCCRKRVLEVSAAAVVVCVFALAISVTAVAWSMLPAPICPFCCRKWTQIWQSSRRIARSGAWGVLTLLVVVCYVNILRGL